MKRAKKIIVLGLDGLEPTIVEALLAKNQLPNLAKLQASGAYRRLGTTYPAQTPVAWSTFATGTNPGAHGIFDFLTRDPTTYLPRLALNHYEQKNVFTPPRVVNGRHGVPVWEILTQAGVPTTILRHPLTFPPDVVRGRMLAGVGVPDIRGGLGSYTYYTTDANVTTQQEETVITLRPDARGNLATYIPGPRNPKTRAEYQFAIQLAPHADGAGLTLTSAGQPKTLELRVGAWSEWLKVKFQIAPLVSVKGMVRFYLLRTAPALELYVSPVNFLPAEPLFPISDPPEYSRELENALGTFYTLGMAEEDAGLKNRRLTEEAFLAQCADVVREREAMLRYELERQREGLIFCLFDTPDRLQHLFWRYFEPEHPAHRGEPIAAEMQRVIHDHYRTLDNIVGTVMQYAGTETLCMVLSDHGMASFQRGLNVNTWLYENGLLALKQDIQPGEHNGDFFRNVDWSRTRAYALGLGGIYLNLQGRETNGIVRPDEAEALKDALCRGLTGLIDSTHNRVAVRSVVTREQIYRGAYVQDAPDLLLNFAPGYRASWGTPLGGVPEHCFADNDKKWSGDHCIDPELVPGILFMNRAFDAAQPSLLDLAPTILDAFGLPKSSAMEGRSLLSETTP
jgi:predicted AlkP superfamily phosphohydrolase/phosphomutase